MNADVLIVDAPFPTRLKMDWQEIVGGVVAGVVSGGSAAAASASATFKKIKTRIGVLEELVGSPETPMKSATGVFRIVSDLSTRVKAMETTVSDQSQTMRRWVDDPPDWIGTVIQRARNSTSTNMELQHDFEQRMESRHKMLLDRVNGLEATITTMERTARGNARDLRYVSREEYEEDADRRSKEMLQIKENLAVANGLLRGVMSAIGVLDRGGDK